MKLTYKKQKKIFDIEEKRILFKESEQLLDKTVILLKELETKKGNRSNSIEVFIGTVECVSWSAFLNYPEVKIKSLNGRNRISVDISRWGVTLFEDAHSASNKLAEFTNGLGINLNPTLERTHMLKDFIPPLEFGVDFSSSHVLKKGNQILCFDKINGIIEVIGVDCVGDKWLLTNQQVLNISQHAIYNSETHSYYTMYKDGIEYGINDVDGIREDIFKYINNQMYGLNHEEIELEANNTDLDVKDSINQEILRKVISQVISEKMPEIIAEAVKRLQ